MVLDLTVDRRPRRALYRGLVGADTTARKRRVVHLADGRRPRERYRAAGRRRGLRVLVHGVEGTAFVEVDVTADVGRRAGGIDHRDIHAERAAVG